jgi:hypothetical protein
MVDNDRNDCRRQHDVNDVESSTKKEHSTTNSMMRRRKRGKCRYRHVCLYPHEINNDSHMMMWPVLSLV